MLLLSDREEISRGLAEGLEFKEIGLRLGRDPSVISREVGRHGGRGGYRAVGADTVACAARQRPKLLAVERSAYGQNVGGGWSVSRADFAHYSLRWLNETPKRSNFRSSVEPFASGQVECSRAH
jgi:hypothetical protein